MGQCFMAHLLEFLISETVELNDELAVRGGDLSTGVDDLNDVQLLSQAHFCADLTTQVLDVFHLKDKAGVGVPLVGVLTCEQIWQVSVALLVHHWSSRSTATHPGYGEGGALVSFWEPNKVNWGYSG